METVFQKIIRGEIPADFRYRDDEVVAFDDIRPLAPVHVLIIPVKPIESIQTMEEEDVRVVGKLFLVAKQIAKDLNISEKGYKLLIRAGRDGGQEIAHLHLHLIGGARLREDIRPV
jgi:histidine triad (HIT) family protein